MISKSSPIIITPTVSVDKIQGRKQVCPKCNCQFTAWSSMKSHLIKKHEVLVKQEILDLMYKSRKTYEKEFKSEVKCTIPDCGQSFILLKALDQHLCKAHKKRDAEERYNLVMWYFEMSGGLVQDCQVPNLDYLFKLDDIDRESVQSECHVEVPFKTVTTGQPEPPKEMATFDLTKNKWGVQSIGDDFENLGYRSNTKVSSISKISCSIPKSSSSTCISSSSSIVSSNKYVAKEASRSSKSNNIVCEKGAKIYKKRKMKKGIKLLNVMFVKLQLHPNII